jgi:NADPH:quinone reductase-like Zn-dependent oxidoreductase
MRAVLIENTIGDASKLYIGDAPTPIPSVDEVLVKVEFDSIALID